MEKVDTTLTASVRTSTSKGKAGVSTATEKSAFSNDTTCIGETTNVNAN